MYQPPPYENPGCATDSHWINGRVVHDKHEKDNRTTADLALPFSYHLWWNNFNAYTEHQF